MLLGLYLGTTAFVWVTTFKSMRDMNKRLKEEGYIFDKKRGGVAGNIFVGTIFLILLSIPVINLVFPVSGMDKERSYDEYKNYLLEAGAIDEPELEEIKVNKEIIKEQSIDINNTTREVYRPIHYDDEYENINGNGFTLKKSYYRRMH